MSQVVFEDAWPDVVVTGYELRRSAYRHVESEERISWKIFPGLGRDSSALVVIGDLTVADSFSFAGVTAVAHLRFRHRPEGDLTWADANKVITDHGLWIAYGLYDFAAQAMRASLSGASGIEVPWEGPDPEIHLAELDDSVPANEL